MEDKNSDSNHNLSPAKNDIMEENSAVIVTSNSMSNKKKKKKKGKKKKHQEKLLNKVSKISKKFRLPSKSSKASDENLKIQIINDKYDASFTDQNHGYTNFRQCYSTPNRTHSVSNSDRRNKSPSNSYRVLRGDNKFSNISHPQSHSHENSNFSSDNAKHFNNVSQEPFVAHSSKDMNYLIQEVDFLSSQVESLTQENLRLNDRLYDYHNWDVMSDSDVDIIFKRKDISEKYSGVLKSLVSNLLNGSIDVGELEKLCQRQERNSPEPDSLFAVDCSAVEAEIQNTSVPRYDSSFHEILQKFDENMSPQKAGRIPQECFNCGENHHLSSCQYTLDYRRIAAARRQQKQRNFTSSIRYHVQSKNENDFKPGVISKELREALNISENQIPQYVYRMRVIDYPPGWLHDAAVESSGITLYGSDGNAEKMNAEDADVDSNGVRIQYDPDKLIDYPGFNIPLPPDYIDESYELGLPPLQTHQLRCFRERNMVKPVTVPSRKRPVTSKNDRPMKFQRLDEDMEIEDQNETDESVELVSEFIPPLPESKPPTPPPPPPPLPEEDCDVQIIDEVIMKPSADSQNEGSLSAVDLFKIKSCAEFTSGSSSPSLAELEELKNKIKLQLGMGSEDDPSSNVSLDEDSCTVVEEIGTSDDKTSEESYIVEDEFIASEISSGLSSISDSSSLLNKTDDTPDVPELLERTECKSKLVSLGTPSVSRHSSYSKLPDYEKFSENVSSHIPFENLPNSTGTYSKLKNVLKKVKVTLNNLMH